MLADNVPILVIMHGLTGGEYFPDHIVMTGDCNDHRTPQVHMSLMSELSFQGRSGRRKKADLDFVVLLSTSEDVSNSGMAQFVSFLVSVLTFFLLIKVPASS